MLKHWTITFFGNLAGSLFVMGILVGYADVLSDAAYRTQTIKFATKKVVTPQWHVIFLRGIGANWLVCLACFLACSAREQVSKICKCISFLLSFLQLELTFQTLKCQFGGLLSLL
jgi:formate/nitrite transporter FocA (FNT family)